MRSALLAALVLALLSAAAAPRVHATASEPARAGKSPFAPVLGIYFRSKEPYGGTLAWFQPLTLRKLPGRKAPLRDYFGSWAFSADRAVLASARCDGQGGDPPGIRFVNARTMRVLGDLPLSSSDGCADALTWLRPDRLLAVVNAGSESEVVVVDPLARRVLRREPLPSYRLASARTSDELVLMLTTWGAFAPTRVAVVDADGAVRTVAVDRVLEGTVVDEQSQDYRSRTMQPGLAVDPEGRRAFLIPASGSIAEIDLETLAVCYHDLNRPSLVERFYRWLFPDAEAKAMEGPVREARWLGDGVIAVSGMDYSIAAGTQDGLEEATPAGLKLIDTRSWTSRMLSGTASSFVVAPGIVIAHGGGWDAQRKRSYGPGLLAFGLDGAERWRLHPGKARWIEPAGSIGYLHAVEGRAEVVDLETGRVLGTLRRNERRDPWPRLLAAQASDW